MQLKLKRGPHRLEENLRHFETVWPNLDLCSVRELHGMHTCFLWAASKHPCSSQAATSAIGAFSSTKARTSYVTVGMLAFSSALNALSETRQMASFRSAATPSTVQRR